MTLTMNTNILDRLDAMEAWVHRHRWWVRLVAAAVLVPWLSWFVYTRTTTLPPLRGDLPLLHQVAAAAAPAGDRTADLLSALNLLPSRAFTPPPAGSPWVLNQAIGRFGSASELDFEEALRGDWTPTTRYHLGKIVAYLQQPATVEAMRKIAALAGAPACLPESLAQAYGYEEFAYVKLIAHIFLARARGELVQSQDFEAAVADLRTALQLVTNLEDDGRAQRILAASKARCEVLKEIGLWSREIDLSSEQLHALTCLLQEYRLDWQAVWTRAAAGEVAFCESQLDRFYTMDENGNGWAVVPLDSSDPWNKRFASMINLLSPALNDRATMQKKIRSLPARMALWLTTNPLILNSTRPADNLTPVDYIFMKMDQDFTVSYAGSLVSIVQQQGTATCLALAVYKKRLGRYPDTLDELPVDDVPKDLVDPVAGRPLRYELDKELAYTLVSVPMTGSYDRDSLDWGIFGGYGSYCYGLLFSFPRQTPQDAWTIPAPSSAPATATGNKCDDDTGF